jgi:cell division protein FtsW (lipid II flippase)
VKSSWLVRMVRSFGRFWWDFLIGDTPELFLAVLVILGVVALLSLVGHDNGAALVTLPVLCVAALGASLWRARSASRRR